MAEDNTQTGQGDIQNVDVEPLSDEDLESVAGGAEDDSVNSTSCCSVNSTSCCSVDSTSCCDTELQ